MKNIELLEKLAGTLPDSTNGVFWNDDVLHAFEKLPKNDIFTGDTFVGIVEKFLSKIEMDFEDRASDYAYDLWNIGNASKIALYDGDILGVLNQLEENKFSYENEIDKHSVELRYLIDIYKNKNKKEG
jgi:hypothetical protein